MEIMKEDPSPRIDILLSTYNGALYLNELIESILKQSYENWRLIVRDDGSSDKTVEIVKFYADEFPGKVSLIRENEKRLGACGSFKKLLELTDAEYIMFCDQDDVWLPNKIELTFKKIREMETLYKGFPLLVHTDMKVVDSGLSVISESFWKYQNLDPNLKKLNYLLLLNNVTGCTVMMNNELRDKAMPIPPGAILHDWWVALVASAFGKVEFVNTPTVLYRQHGKNETGAVKYSLKYFVSRVKDLNKSIDLLYRVLAQAKAFFTAYDNRLSTQEREKAFNFSSLLEKNKLARLYTILTYKFEACGFFRNLGILSLLLMMSNRNLEDRVSKNNA